MVWKYKQQRRRKIQAGVKVIPWLSLRRQGTRDQYARQPGKNSPQLGGRIYVERQTRRGQDIRARSMMTTAFDRG